MDAETLKQILCHVPDDYEIKVIDDKGNKYNIRDNIEVEIIDKELILKTI